MQKCDKFWCCVGFRLWWKSLFCRYGSQTVGTSWQLAVVCNVCKGSSACWVTVTMYARLKLRNISCIKSCIFECYCLCMQESHVPIISHNAISIQLHSFDHSLYLLTMQREPMLVCPVKHLMRACIYGCTVHTKSSIGWGEHRWNSITDHLRGVSSIELSSDEDCISRLRQRIIKTSP